MGLLQVLIDIKILGLWGSILCFIIGGSAHTRKMDCNVRIPGIRTKSRLPRSVKTASALNPKVLKPETPRPKLLIRQTPPNP